MSTFTFVSALPHLVIWQTQIIEMEPSEENVTASQESDGHANCYLVYLQQYKEQLSANNIKYNSKETSLENTLLLKKVSNLLELISDEAFEFKAATYNLKGLIEKNLFKNTKDAVISFVNGLTFTFDLLNKASLLSNLSATFGDIEEYPNALSYSEAAEEAIQKVKLSSKQDQQIAAAVYNHLAYLYRKVKDSTCIAVYDKARKLWPESNVIANNAAIALIKTYQSDPLPALHEARNILENQYDFAKKNHLFVTPYYLSEALIKMLPHYVPDSAEYQDLREKLDDALLTASVAIEKNPSYCAPYRHKAHSRLAKLKGDYKLVLGDKPEAECLYDDARAFREGLNESSDKKTKFYQKIPSLLPNIPFHHSILYRLPEPQSTNQTVAPIEVKRVYRCI